jgi:hypothetical protein
MAAHMPSATSLLLADTAADTQGGITTSSRLMGQPKFIAGLSLFDRSWMLVTSSCAFGV